MKMKSLVFAAAMLFAAGAIAPQSASAAFIGLTGGPLTDTTLGVDFVDVVVDLSLNGAAPNIVAMELYAEFTGLTPMNSSYQVGTVFTGTTYFETHGRCSSPLVDCNYPVADPDSASHYLAQLNVLPPDRPAGPGILFSLRFSVDPSLSQWSVNLFGDEKSALIAEEDPPCSDPNCLPPIPFEIVSGTSVGRGMARVNVTATPGVPEPALLLLMAAGATAAIRRRRGTTA